MLHGIAWATVQRMLIDAPGIEDTKGNKPGHSGEDAEIVLTEDNAAEVMNLINRMNR